MIKRYKQRFNGLGPMVEDNKGGWVTFEEYEVKVLGRNKDMQDATNNMEIAYNNMEITYKNINVAHNKEINSLRTVIMTSSCAIFVLLMTLLFGWL